MLTESFTTLINASSNRSNHNRSAKAIKETKKMPQLNCEQSNPRPSFCGQEQPSLSEQIRISSVNNAAADWLDRPQKVRWKGTSQFGNYLVYASGK